MLIGIDGGGTKTALVLSENDGRIIASVKGSGTNIADIGLEECEKRLTAQLDELLMAHGGRNAEIDSVYAGIAGSSNDVSKAGLFSILTRILPRTRVHDNHSDAFSLLYGVAEEGIVLISGTGSSAFAITRNGHYQVGGWGYLIDDAGSGFRIGADTLKAAYRAYDGRGNDTLLLKAVRARLGDNLKQAIPEIYRGGKSFIASFAPCAFEAAEAGDETALFILKTAAEELALHLKVCLEHIESRPAAAILNGGLTRNQYFLSLIHSALGEDAVNINLMHSELPPVYGSLVKAARNAGLSPDNSFLENFSNTYTL